MEVNSAVLVGFIIAASGLSIVWQLQQLRYAVLALVSLSARKGDLPAVDWQKLSRIAPKAEQSSSATHIHFPNSMFGEQSQEDYDRKHPPQLR